MYTLWGLMEGGTISVLGQLGPQEWDAVWRQKRGPRTDSLKRRVVPNCGDWDVEVRDGCAVCVCELTGQSQKHSGLAVRVEEDKGREEQAILHLSAVNACSWDH